MDGRERAVVAGVERRQQIERLGPAHLADHDPVRAASAGRCGAGRGSSPLPSPRRRPGRLSRRTTCGCWRRSSAASSIVTTRSPGADEARERVEQGRLAGARAAADDDAAALRTASASDSSCARRQRPHSTSSSRTGPADAEAADRERRPVDRQGRDHDVDPRAVGEPRVDHRAELVDPPPERRQDSLDRVPQLLLVGEGDVGRLDPPAALDVDAPRAVDHHLLDRGVGEQVLERSEADACRGGSAATIASRSAVAEQRRLLVDQLARPRAARSAPPARRRGAASARRRSISRARSDAASSARGAPAPPPLTRRQQRHAAGKALGGDQPQGLAPGQAERRRRRPARVRAFERRVRAQAAAPGGGDVGAPGPGPVGSVVTITSTFAPAGLAPPRPAAHRSR